MNNRTTLGIFDSGVGGVTLTKELISLLPYHDIIYLADTDRFPYGTKSTLSVIQYATEAVEFLLEEGSQAIVIACNTVCSTALTKLKTLFSIPFFDIIEPVAKKAVLTSKTKKIGLIATPQTVKSGIYSTYIENLIAIPTPLLAQIVEQGCQNREEIEHILHEYLFAMKGKIDTLISGCTHYMLLNPYIQQELGEEVRIIDPSPILAKKIASTLSHENLPTQPSIRFFTTGNPDKFKVIAEPILGKQIPNAYLATIGRRPTHV
jgi:glutamate racemase